MCFFSQFRNDNGACAHGGGVVLQALLALATLLLLLFEQQLLFWNLHYLYNFQENYPQPQAVQALL